MSVIIKFLDSYETRVLHVKNSFAIEVQKEKWKLLKKLKKN